jgi:hypothetical protein
MAEFDGRTSGPLVEANQAVEFCYISDPMRSSADRKYRNPTVSRAIGCAIVSHRSPSATVVILMAPTHREGSPMGDIGRRQFNTLVGGAAATVSLAQVVLAQQQAARVIGFLHGASPERFAPIRQDTWSHPPEHAVRPGRRGDRIGCKLLRAS